MLAVVAVVLASLVPVVIGVASAWRAAREMAGPLAEAISSMSSTVGSSRAAKTTADLKDLPRGHHDLDVTPPAGGYGNVDAVAMLPWALAIAQAWEADAQIGRIDVERLRPDGTLDVQDDASAVLRYRFVSPRRTERLRQQARLQADAEDAVGFWVTVTAGQPRVYAEVRPGAALRDLEEAPYPSALPLPDLFGRPAVKALAADLPFLKGYLIPLPREGWVWYFSSLANESRPRVRARDGAVWPYR